MATCCTIRLVVGRLVEVNRLTVLSLQRLPDAPQRYLVNLLLFILPQYFLLGRLVQRVLYPQGHCCSSQCLVSLQSFPSYFISV
jgi:hypothetical protein